MDTVDVLSLKKHGIHLATEVVGDWIHLIVIKGTHEKRICFKCFTNWHANELRHLMLNKLKLKDRTKSVILKHATLLPPPVESLVQFEHVKMVEHRSSSILPTSRLSSCDDAPINYAELSNYGNNH